MKSEVNENALAALRDSFDTRQILDLVDSIDQIRSRICEPDAFRAELLELHTTACAVINEGTSDAPESLWEIADELGMELSEWAEKLQEGAHLLDQLAMLASKVCEVEED